jgi:hypothetical protein
MSGGFKVVLSDLQTASGVFTSESKTLAAVIAQHGQKLQTAHDNHAKVDTGLSEFCQQLTLAGSGD